MNEMSRAELEYFAWRDAKVSAALADVKAHPENRIPQSVVWKKFSLTAR
jgi:hypothetical protein